MEGRTDGGQHPSSCVYALERWNDACGAVRLFAQFVVEAAASFR